MNQFPHLRPDRAAPGEGLRRWASNRRGTVHAPVLARRPAVPLPRHRAVRPGAARPAHRMARRPRWALALVCVLGVGLACVLVCLLGVGPAAAAAPLRSSPAAGPPALAQVTTTITDLEEVVDNATRWLVGILATLATFFLTLGAIKYLTAGGDPSEVERAKGSFRNAAIGYALAVLAPVILTVLQDILGVAS